MGGSSIQSSTLDFGRVVLVIFPFSKITLAHQQSAGRAVRPGCIVACSPPPTQRSRLAGSAIVELAVASLFPSALRNHPPPALDIDADGRTPVYLATASSHLHSASRWGTHRPHMSTSRQKQRVQVTTSPGFGAMVANHSSPGRW